ncbi:MAG: NUDIX hydrolase [Microthrixaceae bacterium]|nr:NUDIX hydrolase [Microthrixaceae bacterium]MCO5322665.1 NUDIX hydrolase [Microthrixaceae bacterium]
MNASAVNDDRDLIRAAGGVVWRAHTGDLADGVEVLLVHRPRYSDWSLPKGKLEPGEKHKAAALREVREETGLNCRLGEKLARISYDTPLGPKRVKWWAMQPEDPSAGLGADDPLEVSEVRWFPFAEAWHTLTYGTEREVLSAFAEVVLGA